MTEPDAQALTALASATAREVGSHLLQWRRERRSIPSDTKSGPTDVVTTADHEAEEMIRERLLAAYPDAAWWGEESGRSSGSGADLEWVVDPIDGTVNFLYGLPGWAVSIAAVWHGEVVGAAVMVPTTATLFSASKGMGAWVDDDGHRSRLAVTECVELVPGADRDRLRVRGGNPRQAGGRCWPSGQPGARHPTRWCGVGRPVLGRGRPGRRLLRERPAAVGLSCWRADRPRGRGCRDRARRRLRGGVRSAACCTSGDVVE